MPAVQDIKEVGKAIGEPEDMSEATCMQKAFVVLRACLYFMAWVTCLLAVAVWHIWTQKGTKFLNTGRPDGGNQYDSVCIFTTQIPEYWLASPKPQPPSDKKFTNQCNFFLYSVSVGVVYAFVFFVTTLCLLRNKRVKFKYLEVMELGMAILLVISSVVAGALVSIGIKESCDKWLSDEACGAGCKSQRSDSSCTATVQFLFGVSQLDDVKSMADYMKWTLIVRDGVWAGCVAYLVMAIILFVRYRMVHHGADHAQPVSNYAKFGDEGKGKDAGMELKPVNDIGYQSGNPSPTSPNELAGESTTDGDGEEGNPFG